jgi:hypothetical protein
MRNVLYILLLLPFFSCQEEVFLDLKVSEPLPVIEAIYTNVNSANYVKISMSRDFFETGPNRSRADAEVFIRNVRTNNRINFRYSPQFNRYQPVGSFGGRIGETYELNVRIDNKLYQSTGTMLAPPRLDSIQVNFSEARLFREEGYYLTLFGDIPFDRDNNYRIRIVRNDTLLNGRNDYLLFDDSFGTSILNKGFELNGFPFRKGDNVRLELFRLNRDAYNYLNQLVSLLFNDGGLFSPPPQNPQSNIREINGNGEVLGYFKVSPLLFVTVKIRGD